MIFLGGGRRAPMFISWERSDRNKDGKRTGIIPGVHETSERVRTQKLGIKELPAMTAECDVSPNNELLTVTLQQIHWNALLNLIRVITFKQASTVKLFHTRKGKQWLRVSVCFYEWLWQLGSSCVWLTAAPRPPVICLPKSANAGVKSGPLEITLESTARDGNLFWFICVTHSIHNTSSRTHVRTHTYTHTPWSEQQGEQWFPGNNGKKAKPVMNVTVSAWISKSVVL